jgi:glycosyltransferase involved in cell wall biosynthesis
MGRRRRLFRSCLKGCDLGKTLLELLALGLAVEPTVSVIIATRNRSLLFARMLQSLDRALSTASVDAQVVVVNNGSTDTTAAVIDDWIRRAPGRLACFAPQPGKAHALNQALRLVRAPLLAFTDDDVEVQPQWLQAILGFFVEHPEYGAAMGRVLVPPHVTDPALHARIAHYGTLPFFDRGDAVSDGKHLYGCNMVVRRTVLEQVGPFNERLGVGASGMHEDGDLARRILRSRVRIGYMPNVVVYHAVEPERLTLEHFRIVHLRRACSRFEMDPNRGWGSRLAHWLGAAVLFVWWSLLRNSRQIMRARGQLICHTELLRLQWRRSWQSAR